MVKEITVRRVGGSIGATLPKELVDRFGLEAGDRILAVETADGILLTPYDRLTAEALEAAAKMSRRYRNALRELSR
jgi:putative addiction module antidote